MSKMNKKEIIHIISGYVAFICIPVIYICESIWYGWKGRMTLKDIYVEWKTYKESGNPWGIFDE